jgi:hypothetical protein
MNFYWVLWISFDSDKVRRYLEFLSEPQIVALVELVNPKMIWV